MVFFARFIVWCVIAWILHALIHVHAQTQIGYISIDCGSPEGVADGYMDTDTNMWYVSDESYITTGVNLNISSQYKHPMIAKPLIDLRSFPQGNKNCYTLRPSGGKSSVNLIRATFMYGNYDVEENLPEFDLYLGVNLWLSVKFINASDIVTTEIISIALEDTLAVCLVNKGKGIPFISSLELRPLNSSIYKIVPGAGSSGALVLFQRFDVGNTNGRSRYTDDIYDRLWSPYNSLLWDSLHTDIGIDITGNGYQAPNEVMQTGCTPKDVTKSLDFSWNISDSKTEFSVYLYFAELDMLRNGTREFNILWNGATKYENVKPLRFESTVYNLEALVGNQHKISIRRSGSGNLPPILNAIEIYKVQRFSDLETSGRDVNAVEKIRRTYNVTKNWVGDPCGPKNYSWEGVICNYTDSNPPRIIDLNLSASGLTGLIAVCIENLTALETLDLSNNRLNGSIPKFLENLPLLKFLDLRGNQLSDYVPKALLDRSKSGSLTLRVDSQNLCHSESCKNKKKRVVVPIVASLISFLILLVLFIVLWRIKSKRRAHIEKKTTDDEPRALESRNKRFTSAEVANITNNLETPIGKGGFGTVYRGRLENGKQVAVKLLADESSQGYTEFENEAELLMRVHHKNLVSFEGYSYDGHEMGLVYEYMANGNLKDYLSDENKLPLRWEMRLRIAIDSAQGLDYLHRGCRPAIIHRDVKPANILLSANLEAKIADFGLSKGLPEDQTHIQTDVVAGTRQYLDPEYRMSKHLTEKSDVYSFGIVLLELITGKPVVIETPDPIHIIQYVRPYVEQGEITSIVDEKMGGDFNEDSVWKAIHISVASIKLTSIERPTMSEVLKCLEECLDMELGRGLENQVDSEIREMAGVRMDNSGVGCSTTFEITAPTARD